MDEKTLITIGKVTGVHGLKGYLKIVSYAESNTIFRPGLNFYITAGSDSGRYEVEAASPHKKGMLVLFRDMDVDKAQKLLGRDLCVSREDLPEPEAGSYYWQDLVGMEVIDETQGVLGVIDSILPTGSNDVYVVKGGQREVMVPALASVVISVDIENKQMRIDLPEGL
ncbi:MAG: ribosome maturation factor RimM [Pseudomonadota bacterium]